MLAEQGDRVRGAGDPAGRGAAGPARPSDQRPGHPSQRCRVAAYTSVRFGQTLLLAGLTPSVGTVGDALDNALAETTIGLYKTECTRDGSPFRTGPVRSLGDLEEITSAWVHWYNTSRLMHRLGRRPPTEAEAEYWRQARDAA
jgi:transposase InsO family protein